MNTVEEKGGSLVLSFGEGERGGGDSKNSLGK
jgi:hypothetical protein